MEKSSCMCNIIRNTVAAGLIVCATTVSLIAGPVAGPGHHPNPPGHAKRGTDILHWGVRKAMTNEDTNSTATAKLDIRQNTQGRADNHHFKLLARGLDTNATYSIWAAIQDDTNFVHVSDFETDRYGRARVFMKKIGSSQGRGHPKGFQSLPAAIDPVSGIREIAIGNVNTQYVFSANLTAPDKLEYLVKRHMEQDSVSADLRLKATTKRLDFKLTVSGLDATNSYFLALNNEIVATGDSSATGKLSFNSIPVNPADILTIKEVAVWNSSSNSVISTQLP
jgi:hypothetical protein